MNQQNNPLTASFKLGFLGAGQLARMSALQAFRLGIQVGVFSDRTEKEPVEFVTPTSSPGSFSSPEEMAGFAQHCDILTLENEFISSDILKQIQNISSVPIYPSPETFALIDNKLIEKQTFEKAGIPVTPYQFIKDESDLEKFGETHSWPFILKSSKGGYDGYGNETVHNLQEASEAFKSLGGHKDHDIIAESFVEFTHELAVQVARNETGHVVYPCCETVQENHICVAVKSPAPVSTDIQEKAQQLAVLATETIDGKGIFAYEFFLTKKGELLLNESAPRPHNSGHYTIEGCVTSQFENHVRAVMGLPLGSPALRVPAVVMINLLGTDQREAQLDEYEAALKQSDGHLHVYGKLSSRPGRKMAHYTLLGQEMSQTYEQARSVTESIRI